MLTWRKTRPLAFFDLNYNCDVITQYLERFTRTDKGERERKGKVGFL